MFMGASIENQPLPLFFRQIFMKNLSGRLKVTVKDFSMTLDFAAGKLANASSTRFDEKLLVILHLMGKLTEEQYNFSSGLHQFPDDQVSDMLLENRFVKKKDLYTARIFQLRRIAVSLFSLHQGKWEFSASPAAPESENFEIPLAGIIAEGARTIERISSFSNRWLFHIPKPRSDIPHHLDVYFTNDEHRFHSRLLAEGQRTCRELISRLDLQPIDFWRKILVFHLLGILEFEASRTDTDVTGDVAELVLLHQRMQQVDGDDFRLLGLSADASATAIENAQSQLLARFSPDRFGSAAAPEIKRIASDVCQRLQKIRPLTPESEDLTLLGTEEAVLKIGAEPFTAEPIIVEPTIEEPVSEEPVIEELVSEELVSEELVSEELVIEEPVNIADRISEIPEPADAAPHVPEPPPAGMLLPESPHEKAWNHYLKGKEWFEKREFTKAIDVIRQAIKLEPGQGDFYFLLGLCQSEMEMTQSEAEVNLKRAVELTPWSAEPVYALGLLFRRQKKNKMAERCFQRVKEIAAGHTGASQAVIDLRRQRAGKKAKISFLKKKNP